MNPYSQHNPFSIHFGKHRKVNLPRPSQSTWDTLLAVLVGASISLAGYYAGQSSQNCGFNQGEPE